MLIIIYILTFLSVLSFYMRAEQGTFMGMVPKRLFGYFKWLRSTGLLLLLTAIGLMMVLEYDMFIAIVVVMMLWAFMASCWVLLVPFILKRRLK
ncbi:MAG: hypothetical protein AAGA02_03445 [Bacteroidota bacterium]